MPRLSEYVTVSPQILVKDLVALKAAGVTQLVCNRPDNEDVGQPTFAEIAEVAKAQGITTTHIPVTGGEFPNEAIDAVVEILAKGEVTHMYCRSGTRSAILWACAQVKTGADVASVIDVAAEAGYGIGQLEVFLATQAN